MKHFARVRIDWQKTALNLKLLRNDDLKLRRYVCRELRKECDLVCENCKYEMDSSISQSELARAFGVKESQIANWENGKSHPALEYLILYSRVCEKELFDIVVVVQ